MLSIANIESMGSKPQEVSLFGRRVAKNIQDEANKRGLSDRALSRILGKASSYVTNRTLLRHEWSLGDVETLAGEWGMDVEQLMR